MAKPTASTAHVWVNCPGSVALATASPDPDRDAPRRLEGREWHAVAETYLKEGKLTGTDEQQAGAELSRETLTALAPWGAWRAEKSVDLSWIHPSIPPGRVDASAWRDGWLRVADYKAGRSYVSELDNWQALLYLAGLLHQLQQDGEVPDTPQAEEAIRVSVTIVQPRYYGQHPQARTWTGRASVLRAFVNLARDAAALTQAEAPPLKVGPWCAKCDAKHACDLLSTASGAIAEWAEEARPAPPTPERVGLELRMLHEAQKLLKARADGLEAQALHFLQRGQGVAGFEMGTTQPRERFDPERVEELLALGQLLGVDLAKPREPITPAQARKLGIDKGVIDSYAIRPAGERKLVPVDFDYSKRIFSNGK